MSNETTKKKVVFRGPHLTISGYGTHARQIANWLLKKQEVDKDIDVTFDVVPWGMTPWFVDKNACEGLVGKVIQNSNKKDNYDVSFQLQLPNEWDPFLAKTNVGITAAVETDRCNPAWIDAVNRMDMVVVPSEHTKQTLVNSGEVKTRIEVIPESWFEPCRAMQRGQSSLDLNLETDFNFLMVAQFTGNNPENDRKNISYTIKWIMEEFKDDMNVGLIVKTNFGRQTKADKQNCLRALTQILVQCRKGPAPRVYLLHGHMTDEEMANLYTHPKIKSLVSLTRGEGFGLPILEAATCGLPVIATDWSAHTEFLKQGKYVKVDYSLTPIHESRIDENLFMKGAQWAFANEKDAKRKMRRFYESPSIPSEWATELQKVLKTSHSPETIESQYSKLLKKLEL